MPGIAWRGTSWLGRWRGECAQGSSLRLRRKESDHSGLYTWCVCVRERESGGEGQGFHSKINESHWKTVNRGVTLFDTFLKGHSVLKINILLPSNSTPRYSPKTNENVCSQRNVRVRNIGYNKVKIIIATNWKQSTYPSI